MSTMTDRQPEADELDRGLLGGGPSDGSLVRRFRRGDEDAATQLYLRYAQRLEKLAQEESGRDVAVRFDPEDVVQSVFRTFFRRVAAGQYELPEGEELWRLMLVIALNKIRRLGLHHRAGKRDARRTKQVEHLEAHTAAESHETALATLNLVVEELLAELPPPSRRMIELRIAGHEMSEIAALTDRSLRSVERVLQHFRQRLSRLIDEPA